MFFFVKHIIDNFINLLSLISFPATIMTIVKKKQ